MTASESEGTATSEKADIVPDKIHGICNISQIATDQVCNFLVPPVGLNVISTTGYVFIFLL